MIHLISNYLTAVAFFGNYVHSGSKNELTGDIVVSQFLKFLNINLLNCYIYHTCS